MDSHDCALDYCTNGNCDMANEKSPQPQSALSNPQIIAAIIGGLVTIVVAVVGIIPAILQNQKANATPTSVVVTATPAPPTTAPTSLPTAIPAQAATNVPSPASVGATPAPADWLPVRFIYNADAFYWMNDSRQTISAEFIVFEQVSGGKRFEGKQFAFYSLLANRCMQIMFAEVARQGCPESRRPNAFFTPTRAQNVDFWIGRGQFRVLWRGAEVALCDIAAGQCSAFLPPS
jgi:hypothetical protein